MLTLLAGVALAAPGFTDLGFVLTAPADGPFAGGVNAPTVAWDGARYVMFFESPSADVPADCATTWSIGRATSPDGVTWTLDAAPVLAPDRDDPGSVYSCSVAQPAVVHDGATFHLFFGMGDEKQDSAATINFPAGVGYATSADGVAFTVREAPTALGDFDDGDPEWHAPDGGLHTLAIGMPSAVLVNDTIRLVYMVSTKLHAAKLDLSDGAWRIWDPEVTGAFTGQPWASQGVFSPALYCDADAERIGLLVGGYPEPTFVTRTAGLATSVDLVDWSVADTFDAPPFAGLNHLEVLPAGDQLLVYYSATDPGTGLKAIGLATTATSWPTPDGRRCAWDETPPDTGDTGDTADLGDDDTADTGDDTASVDTGDSGDSADTGADDPGPVPCGCASGRTGGLGVLGILTSLALARRRRG